MVHWSKVQQVVSVRPGESWRWSGRAAPELSPVAHSSASTTIRQPAGRRQPRVLTPKPSLVGEMWTAQQSFRRPAFPQQFEPVSRSEPARSQVPPVQPLQPEQLQPQPVVLLRPLQPRAEREASRAPEPQALELRPLELPELESGARPIRPQLQWPQLQCLRFWRPRSFPFSPWLQRSKQYHRLWLQLFRLQWLNRRHL